MFATIIAGVIVFVMGQAALRMIIEPIQNLRVTISEIAFCLRNNYVYYMNSETVAEEDSDATHRRLRELGSRLFADMSLIPFYSFFSTRSSLPEIEEIVEASEKLFALSNWQGTKRQEKYEQLDLLRIRICKLLNIHLSSGEPTEEMLVESIKAYRDAQRNT